MLIFGCQRSDGRHSFRSIRDRQGLRRGLLTDYRFTSSTKRHECCWHRSTLAEGSSHARNFVIVSGPTAWSSDSIGRANKTVCELPRVRVSAASSKRIQAKIPAHCGAERRFARTRGNCARARTQLHTAAAAAYLTRRYLSNWRSVTDVFASIAMSRR